MSREIEVEWPDFAVTVTVELLENENPRLCDELWQALPFETVFAGTMSSGELLKFPIPITLPTAAEEKLVLFPDQPPGTVVMLNDLAILFINYGPIAEPFRVPRIGIIRGEDLEKLRSVAMKIRDAYYFTKQVNIATVRKKK